MKTPMTFDTLSLHPKILKAVAGAGYLEPTMIQLKAIPKIIKGFDIRASAQTGTGKTAAFLLPALTRLATPSQLPGKGPRIVILVPTRELAMQISSQAEKYSKFLQRVKSVCIVGGVPYNPQIRQLSKPYEILIATPGRLLDYIERGKMNFSRTEMLVLDEADRMLDMGFSEPVEQIVSKLPKERQTLLFSATLRGSVLELSERLMNNPMEIVVHSKKEKHEHIDQKLHYVDHINHKNRLLEHILGQDNVNFAIVFTSTKKHAEQLVGELREKGLSAAALHGDMKQRQRTRTLAGLRSGKIKLLIATDVAARGIDLDSVSHIINFDLPRNVEDYVHRIGRTGRAGAAGTAVSFASGKETFLVKKIEQYTGHPIEVIEIPGFEPKAKQGPGKQGPKKGPRNARSSKQKRAFPAKKGRPQFRPSKEGRFGRRKNRA